VVNCAADYSADYHKEKGVKYLSLHLKDHVRENIECSFYDVIDFMESAKKEGGRVFVHCVQGISRSTTMCLCYMIFTQKVSLDDGLKFIRERRQIANPNMTFMAQLIWFHKRLYATSIDSVPVSPRVFLVSSHQPEDPYRISCRMLMENMYQGEKSKLLDPRCVFLVQGPSTCPLYIWQGANVLEGNLGPYMDASNHHAKLLQQHEKANQEIVVIQQGKEDDRFWNLFFSSGEKPPTSSLYGSVAEWDRLIIDLATINHVMAAPVVTQMQDYKILVDEEKKMKPRLFTYPDWNESSTVFDFEDLLEDTYLILCVRANHSEPGHEHDAHQAYIWKGGDFDEEEASNEVISVEDFKKKVLEQYWGCKNPEEQFNI
jgi:hypothetical protein